jgi:hypothetical protein
MELINRGSLMRGSPRPLPHTHARREKNPSKKAREEFIANFLPYRFQVKCGFSPGLFQLDQDDLKRLIGQVLGQMAPGRKPHGLARDEAVLFGFAIQKCESRVL